MSDLFDLHEGAERHLRTAGNLPKHLAAPLLEENNRMEEMWATAQLADEMAAAITAELSAEVEHSFRTKAAILAWSGRE